MTIKKTLFEISIFSKNGRKIHTEVFSFSPYCGANIDEVRESIYYPMVKSTAQNICDKHNGYTWRFSYIAKRYKNIA